MTSSGRLAMLRAGFLFADFFLIILAYYQVKPASRSLFLEHLPADSLPYLWIGSALTLGLLMPAYQAIVRRFSRFKVVLGSCATSMALLVAFRFVIEQDGPVTAVAFYIFVDIMSVVLVEQLWSMTDASFRTEEGYRWYGLVASGGLVGGMLSGWVGGMLLQYTELSTPDLLLVAAGILGLILLLSLVLVRLGLLAEHTVRPEAVPNLAVDLSSWRLLWSNRYLLAIATILLTAQLIQPIIEYQFLHLVEDTYTERDARTAFLAHFFSVLSAVALGVNLMIVPVVHRLFGAIGGLLAQPLAVLVAAVMFALSGAFAVAAVMKICDRGLSYSINRVSRELLYVPIDSVTIYRAKAWIDMFGYRLFRIVGSLVIKLVTVWLPVQLALGELSWIVVGICVLWMVLVVRLSTDYRQLRARETAPPSV